MKFSRAKLPESSLPELRKVSARLVRPYELMASPVYVHLPTNEKFVAVKAPLNFFTPTEIDKLKGYGEFYFPDFLETIVPFHRAGEAVRKLIGGSRVYKINTSNQPAIVKIPLSPFEIDDSILQVIGQLWGVGARIEPYFLTFFASEICDPLSRDQLAEAAEKDIQRLELGCVRAGVAVFLALHVGMCNIALLTGIRDRILRETMTEGAESLPVGTSDVDLLVALVNRTVPDLAYRAISVAKFSKEFGRFAAKLRARMVRVSKHMITPDRISPSIYGKKGIRDE